MPSRGYAKLFSDRDRATAPTRQGDRYVSAELRAATKEHLAERDADMVAEVTLWTGAEDGRPRLEVKVANLPPSMQVLPVSVNGADVNTVALVSFGPHAGEKHT